VKAWVVPLVAGIAMGAAACGSSPKPHIAAQVLPSDRARTDAIPVALREFSFEIDRVTVPAGSIDFKITNEGLERHELAVVPFDGKRYGLPVAEHEAIPPGQSGLLRARYEPGRYRIVCLLITSLRGDPESHLELGMVAEFEVTS
jgi:Cupredoxin-like domain